MRIKILRFSDGKKFYKEYEVPNLRTVLEALIYIRENIDPTLAFNYSCRSGICGACAVKIDDNARLACKTGLRDGMKIEPIDGFKIVKDLIIDDDEFFDIYRKIGLYTEINDKKSIDREIKRKINVFDRCILCLICVSSCNVCREYCFEGFLSPAIIARAYRLFLDERNVFREKILESIKNGVDACRFYYACTRNCPRGVAPSKAIKEFKSILKNPKPL